MTFKARIYTPEQVKARAAQNRVYRSRPEVAARRQARRAQERATARAQRSNETSAEREARLVLSRAYETRRRVSMSVSEKRKRSARAIAWKKQHPLSVSDHGRLYKYGLLPAAIEALRTRQSGACGICMRPLIANTVKRNGEHIDHCHVTGHVRGILCGSCNTAIGQLGDNIEGVQRALNYLIRSEELRNGI